MSTTDLYYKHSGKFNPVTWCFALISVGILGTLVGGVYGVLIYYMPLIYINGLVCVGFGVGAGYVAGKTMELVQVRNTLICLISGIAVGILAEYGAFVGWVYIVSYDNYPPEQQLSIIQYMTPSILIEELKFLASEGVWGLFGDEPVTGMFLYTIWAFEGAIIIGGSTLIATGFLIDEPFCEKNAKSGLKIQKLLDRLVFSSTAISFAIISRKASSPR